MLINELMNNGGWKHGVLSADWMIDKNFIHFL